MVIQQPDGRMTTHPHYAEPTPFERRVALRRGRITQQHRRQRFRNVFLAAAILVGFVGIGLIISGPLRIGSAFSLTEGTPAQQSIAQDRVIPPVLHSGAIQQGAH